MTIPQLLQMTSPRIGSVTSLLLRALHIEHLRGGVSITRAAFDVTIQRIKTILTFAFIYLYIPNPTTARTNKDKGQ